jgi:Rrf2 family protein
MFLTKECDYGIRVVRALASGKITTVKDICEDEHIPQPFAYKILKKLEKSGIVISHRGHAGGYQLIGDLDKLTLLDIVAGIDDQLFLNKCLKEGYECPNNNKEACCKVHEELKRAQSVLVKTLSENTINEILSNPNYA